MRLAQQASLHNGRQIGLYPELKHPSYFRGIGLPLEDKLVDALRRQPYLHEAPVFIQSFEAGSLRHVRRTIGHGMPNVRLMQLIGKPKQTPPDWRLAGDTRTYGDMLSVTGLREVATYADGIGPEKNSVVPRDAQGGLGAPSAVVRNAHAAGLLVHPYTFRPENAFLPKSFQTGGDDATRSPADGARGAGLCRGGRGRRLYRRPCARPARHRRQRPMKHGPAAGLHLRPPARSLNRPLPQTP